MEECNDGEEEEVEEYRDGAGGEYLSMGGVYVGEGGAG